MYPALSRAMLLLSGAATAAAEFDEAYSLQETVTSVMMATHRRATAAITDAQALIARASAAIALSASSAVARSGAGEVVGAARVAVDTALERLAALIDTAPEGSVVDTVRSGLVLAHAELAEVVTAWETGREAGVGEAASAALTRARDAISTLAGAGVATASEAGAASLGAARTRAEAAVAAAREQVLLAQGRMAPAVAEASALGSEGVGRLSAAAAVLARAVEDVVVEAAAAADSATGCTERARGTWHSLHLTAVVDRAAGTLEAVADNGAAKAALEKAADVDQAACCGCVTRTASWVLGVAESALGYASHVAGRVVTARVLLDAKAFPAEGADHGDGSLLLAGAGGKPAPVSKPLGSWAKPLRVHEGAEHERAEE